MDPTAAEIAEALRDADNSELVELRKELAGRAEHVAAILAGAQTAATSSDEAVRALLKAARNILKKASSDDLKTLADEIDDVLRRYAADKAAGR